MIYGLLAILSKNLELSSLATQDPSKMIFGVLATAVLGLLIYIWVSRPQNLPPGPRGWPVIGAAHLLSEAIYLDFENMAKKYGDIFSLYIGRG